MKAVLVTLFAALVFVACTKKEEAPAAAPVAPTTEVAPAPAPVETPAPEATAPTTEAAPATK